MRTKSSKHIANFLNSSSLTRPLIALGAASVLFGSGSAKALDPGALPQDPTVTGGKATFAQSGNTLNVNQSTNRTIIDWRSFNIGSKAQTNFNQPNSSSIAVNRVNGSTNPSDIEGGLHANGQVWILNPNGVFFGKNARVDAAGIVASTANIDDKAFMAGSNKLQMTGADHGSVENQGDITVGASGLAAFVAPSVRNSGTINATVGKVTLAAGTTYTLDLAGDHMVELGLGSVKAVVDNSGKIVNPGGTITLTAKAAGQVVDSVVNVSGIVSASSVTKSGGTIVLGGDNVTTTKTAQLSADAGTNGDGGTITSVADNQGSYAGTFSAKGGSQSGNGGKIETSGKTVSVDASAKIDASATNGTAGTWLLDPLNVTIASGSNDGNLTGSTVYTGTIENSLSGGTSVDITTSQSGSDLGDLNLNGSINATSTGNAGLTLEGRHLFATGGSTINISGGALTLDVNTVNTEADTTGEATNWINDALGMIGSVSGGTTVNLGAGLYAPNVNISVSNVKLDGSAGAEIDVNPGSSQVNAINILGTTDGVTVTGFDIRGEITGSYINYNFGSGVSRGIVVKSGATNFTISDNDIENIRTGILVDGAANLSSSPSNTGTITGNLIDNTKGGLLIQYTDGTGITITGNRQGTAGNEWGEIWHLQGSHTGTASSGVQSALLAASSANNGWTVEDQAYAQSNRTAVTVAAAATNAYQNPSDSNQGSYRSPLATIQAGVNAVVAGGTVDVLSGDYTLSGELDITKSLSLIGAGVGVTNITSNSTGYGINVTADDVSLKDFTFHGPTTVNSTTYGIKVTPDTSVASDRLLNFDIENVTIDRGNRTGLDLNGVDGATIKNVSVSNIVNGNGIALTDSANVTITNSTTTGNAWGGVALYEHNSVYNQQETGIVIDGSNTFHEANGIYAEDESASQDFGTIDLSGQGIAYVGKLHAGTNDDYTFFQTTEQGAINEAAQSPTTGTVQGYAGTNLDGDNTFYVGTSTGGTTMSIQAAVDTAISGATINVAAGTYTQALDISKSVDIEGAGQGLTIIQPTALLSTGVGHKYDGNVQTAVYVHDTSNVTIDAVTIDANNLGANAVVFWNNASGSIENSLIENPMAFTGLQTGQDLAVDATGTNSSNLTVANVTFQNFNKNGIDAETGDGSGANGGTINLIVTGSTFTGRGDTGTNAQNGIVLWEQGGGTINGTIDGDTFSSLSYNDPSSATAAGVLQYGSANGTVTVKNSTFNSSVQEYISTAGGTAHDIDATDNNNFGGVIASGSDTLDQLYTIEDKITDGTDTGTDSLVRLVAGHVYATAAKDNIQAAVDVATAGDIINVQAGTYDNTLDITKSVDIEGAGQGLTIIQPTSLLDSHVGHKYTSDAQVTVLVNGATGVTLNGLTIDGNNLGNDAVVLWNNSSGTIENSLIENARVFNGVQTGQALGVDASTGNTSNLTVANVTFQNFNKNAIDAVTGNGNTTGGGTINLTVDDSTITGAGDTNAIAQNGIVLWERGGGTVNATIDNVSFSGLDYTDPGATSAGVLQYGSANGTVTVKNSTFDSSVQTYISSAGGSTHEIDATDNNSFGGVIASGADTLDQLFAIQDKIIDGLNDSTNGIVRLVAGNVYETAASGDLATAVAKASSGDTVNVQDGSYTLSGELDINKSLSLIGQSEAGVDITSNSTGYGIYVTGDDVSLQNFTYHGPTGTGSTYGIKVEPGTNVPSDRLTGFDIENVTIDRGYRTGLDLNGVDGATIDNVSVSNIVHGNGIALTDSADVTITNSTTNNNAWGGLALYQTNYYYDQQVNNISVDGTNTFNETNGIYIEDQSDGVGTLAHPSVVGGSGLDVGTLNIAGYAFVAADKHNSADQYTFFQKTEQDAIDFATDTTLNGNHLTLADTYVQGWTGTALDSNFYVGTGANSSQLSINTAIGAASSGDTINVDAGTYSESVSVPKQLEFNFDGTGVTVDSFALTSGSANSTLNGKLTASNGDITATDAVNLNGNFEGKGFTFGGGVTLMGDTTIQSSFPGSINSIASVTGGGYDLTVMGNASLGDVSGVDALQFTGAAVLTGTTYTANSETFTSGITLSNDVTLDTSAANGNVSIIVSATGNGHDLTIDTGTGNTSLGNVSSVGALLVDGTSTLTGTSYVADSEEFDGAMELSGDTTLDTSGAGGDITVASVTGNGNGLELNAGAGNTTLGDVSGVNTLLVDGTATLTGSTYSANSEFFDGGITLAGGDATLDTSAADGDIYVAEVTGAGNGLELNAGTGNTTLGDVSGVGTLLVDGTSTLTGTSYVAASEEFDGAVTLNGGDTTLDTSGANGAIRVASVTGNGNGLELNAGAGNTTLGDVSGVNALIVDGTATLNGSSYVAASETFGGAVTLADDVTLDTSAANGNVSVVSVTGAGNDLTINTGTGNTTLGNVSGAGVLTVDGTSTLSGTSYVAASENFGGAVTLTGGTTLDTSAANGDVSVASVTGSGNDLTINAGTGNTTLGDVSGAGALLVDGTSTLGGTYAAASETFGGAVTLAGDATFDTSAANGDIAIASVVGGGNDLTVNAGSGDISLGGISGAGAVALDSAATVNGNVSAASFTAKDALGLTGDLSTTGAVALNGGATINGDVSAASFTTGGTLGLTGDLSATGAVALNGASTINGDVTAGSIATASTLTLVGDATASGAIAFGGATKVTGNLAGASITASKTLALTGDATATGAITVNGAATLSGDLTGGSIALNGATTLAGNVALDTSAANGAISVASVDGTMAGGQSLSIDAGTGDVSLGDLGAATRLAAVRDTGNTTLTGSTYNANSFLFGGDVTLTAADTTLNTTQSSSAAGDITFNGDIFGTTSGGQSLTMIAGPGTGAASANGDITLQNAGTSSVRLNNMTVSGNNFTALTVWLANAFNSTLTGNQVFAADTLHAGGDVTSTVGGNASGHIDADGDVTIDAGGNISGTIGGNNVTLTADDVNATVTAANAASVQANTIEGSYTGNTVSLVASNSVNANVNSATTFDLVSPTGSVTGTWTTIDTTGSGSIDVNGQQTLGQDGVNPNQLVVEGFTLPAGTTIGANGQLILPQGVLLGLLSPGGGKPKMVLVHSVQQLGELLAAGYTVIVIDLKHRGGNEVQLASN